MVESFDMFSERRRVCVAFKTAGDLAHVRFVVLMGSAVFEAITGVAVAFYATRKITFIGFFESVRSNVNFQIFRPRKSFAAVFKGANVRFFFGVCTCMNQHLVASIETSLRSLTTFPFAVVEIILADSTVRDTDVICELFQRLEDSAREKE